MYYLVGLVIDDLDKCSDLFDAWEKVGVSGMTIMDSTGLGRVRRGQGLRDDVPLMPSMRDLLSPREENHRTVFSLVEGETVVDRLIVATEQVLGNLGDPHTGVLFAMPVARVVGLQRNRA